MMEDHEQYCLESDKAKEIKQQIKNVKIQQQLEYICNKLTFCFQVQPQGFDTIKPRASSLKTWDNLGSLNVAKLVEDGILKVATKPETMEPCRIEMGFLCQVTFRGSLRNLLCE